MKKQLTYVMLLAIGVGLFGSALSQAATTSGGTLTGAGRGNFAPGASFSGVALSGVDFGTGVFIEPGGSANGPFTALLTGRSLLGQPRTITVDGNVVRCELTNGQASLNGVATINLGDGSPTLSSVPFTVAASAEGLVLTINSLQLPAAQITVGSIDW